MMSALPQIVADAASNILARRMRSALTMLGVVIGVAAVVAIVSIIQGLSASITRSFDGLGANSLTINSYTPFEDQMKGKVNRLSLNDYHRLSRRLEDVDNLAPSFAPLGTFGAVVRAADRSVFTRVYAVGSQYQEAYRTYAAKGRFINESDSRARRKVCVLGRKVIGELGLPETPIGEVLFVGSDWCRVVGVMEEKGEVLGLSQDDYVLLPFGTGEGLIKDGVEPDIAIALSVRNVNDIDEVQDRIVQALRQIKNVEYGEPDGFKVQTAEQLRKSVAKITDILTFGLVGIVSISLLVGGIGIMNMMLVSVTERTREIGIYKALGAQRLHILLQFLAEATILALSGGVAGVIVGWLLAGLASLLIPGMPPAMLPLWALLLSLGSCLAIGIVFGVIPAAKAASLNPIDALRYE